MRMEHAQGLGTSHLYPANTGMVGHEPNVRDGMVWCGGEWESLFWDSRSISFGRNVLLG